MPRNTDRRPIFELEGASGWKFKGRFRNYVAAYDDGLYVDIFRESMFIPIDRIYHIYIREPPPKDWFYFTRIAMICFYNSDGKEELLALEDFWYSDKICEMMENILENEWIRFNTRKNSPDTVKWYNNCCALIRISSGEDPGLFGGVMRTPDNMKRSAEALREQWGFDGRDDLLSTMHDLLDGRNQWRYVDELMRIQTLTAERQEILKNIDFICGGGGIWAWDLCRVMHISSDGYICGFISYEEALELCKSAGEKLQRTFKNWDEMIMSYVLGYCFWSNDDPKKEKSESRYRAKTYERLKKSRNSPYDLDWNFSLGSDLSGK
ncbi:MAG: DUF1266 domain-containing protein [Candidatus Methanoplasma sp.]|jgi:hypothetical protein|nr:DUF1266 domain-containing protein [Candidatus Methanoplasma sp.]